MKIKIRRSHLLQVLFLIVSIGLGFLLITPLRVEADRRADMLKNRLLGQLEESLDITIKYESISPALLSVVTVRGLMVNFGQGDFTADKVRVFYNPMRRFGGDENNPIRLISRVTVIDGHLNLAITSAGGDMEQIRNTNFDPWPFLVDKSVKLTGISADVRLDESFAFNAENVSLILKEDEGRVRYTFEGLLHADDIGTLRKIGKIESAVSSSGSFSPTESTVNGRLDLLTADSDFIVLESLSVDFTFSDNELTARRVDDARPLDLAFRYSEEGWVFSGEAVGLNLRNIASPGASTGSWDPWFSSVMDGRFAISGYNNPDKLDYDVDLDLSVPSGTMPWGLQAKLDFQGSQDEMQIDLIKLSSNWGDMTYSGTFRMEELAPDGRFSFNLGENLLGYPVIAVFDLETRQGAVSAEPVFFEAAGLEFQDFRFLIIRETDLIALSLIAIPGRPDEDTLRRLTVDALFDTSGEPIVYGFASIEGFESSHIARLVGLRGAEGLSLFQDSLFNMNAYFEANRDSWVVSVNEAELLHKESSGNSVLFKGRASPGSWSLDSLRVSWNDYVINGRGYGKGTENGGFAEGRLLIEEQLYPLSAQWFSDGKVEINGDFGLSAVLGPRSVNGRSVQVISKDVSIPIKNGRLVSEFDIRGMVARRDWDIYINRARLMWTDRTDQYDIAVELNGTIDPGRVVLPDIRLSDSLGNLSGNAFFESADSGNRMQGRLFLGGDEDEIYELAFIRDGDIWDVALDIEAARIERAKRDRLSGQLNAKGRMTGSLKDPLITLNMETSEGFLDGQPFDARGIISMESGRMRIQDVHYEHEGMALSRGLLLLNMVDGSLRTTAELYATYNQVPVSSGFSLAVDFGRGFTMLELSELGDAGFKGTLATRPVLWDAVQHLPAFTFQFTKDSEAFRVQTPDADIFKAEYIFNTGLLGVVSGDPMPVIVRGSGTVKDGQIDLSFPVLDIDPVLINYAMFRDPILLQYHVIFQSGRFVGNLDINGPSNNPELFGKIRADNLKVDTPYTYAEIEPASTDIHFDGHQVTIDRIEIPIGDGIIYGGGHLVLDRLKLIEFDMIYGGKPKGKGAGVPVFYPLMGVNLDGIFTGEVHMTGGNKYFLLEGDFTFPYLKASLGSPIIPVSQAREGVYPTFVFLNFNFITGKNCIFFLPNEQLKIVRATAETGQIINMVYSNNPNNLSLTGNLSIKSGDIFYFDRDFQISEGSLRFNESLGNFDPILALRAETRVRDDEGEDVSVALVYNAPVMSDFKPRIETIPTRSDQEIMALFGQTVIPFAESQGTDATTTVLLATGGLFGQVGIVQPFEEVLREGLNLDMVTIRTDIIENTLAEGLVRDTNPELNSQASGLGRFLDNTSLYAGKYIGNALFISGTVSANYFEGQRLRSVFGGLEFETAVSLEMETPFFNVAWSYSPDPTRNQNFVADNEISLKWQFSY